MAFVFYLFIAAVSAFLGFALGTKGASRQRPVIARRFSWLSYGIAALFAWWAMLELLG